MFKSKICTYRTFKCGFKWPKLTESIKHEQFSVESWSELLWGDDLCDQVSPSVPAAPAAPPTRPCHRSRRNILLSAPLADFSQSDAPTGLSSHGRQSDPPRLPEPRLQPQQRGPGAGHHADGLQGQMEQKDGFPPLCRRLCGGPGKCLEVSLHMLPERGR